jgi:tRNA(Ile)-lysidine synthase
MTGEDKQAASVIGAFERALGVIRARVYTSEAAPLAIAYSGGLDSSALLDLVVQYSAVHRIPVFAFHIHHGLSANADDWLAHCERECIRLGVTFDFRRIALSGANKSGTEEAARIGRYAALGELCRLHRVPVLLTAHQLDDQAETILLQLLRGAGVAGLSGMETVSTAPALLGDAELLVGRPLLQVSRGALAAFVARRQIRHIEDESNADPRFARNVLRHQVMPALAKHFPGFQERFGRTAQHMRSAQQLLDQLAKQDFVACAAGECIDIERLRLLDPDRIDNLLRYWFGLRGIRMPSTAWLLELRTQLLEAKADARLCVTHPEAHIRRHKHKVFLMPRSNTDPVFVAPQEFRWRGETEMRFPRYRGVLRFQKGSEGVDADWLRQQNLTIRHRQGGERLKLATNRSTRSLKHHYQALDIPAWERESLPLVAVGEHLLFAAGIGMDCRHFSVQAKTRIRFEWLVQED